MAESARKTAEDDRSKRLPIRRASSPRKEGAKNLASMIERHMADLGLPEEEKNRRVASFGERVDRAIGNRAKS